LRSSKKSGVDQTLIRACIDGDADAWKELIQRHRRLIYSIPSAYRMSPDAADEVFQIVSVRLFENLGKLRRTEGLVAWLATTARRECQAVFRSRGKTDPLNEDSRELPDEGPEVQEQLEAVESEHTLELAFARLGDRCRTLLDALYKEDPRPAYEELAERLGYPVGSLGPTRSRCLAKLKKLYIELGGAPP
jgi:RNA polymerase sigma factor (sigma-70 family)